MEKYIYVEKGMMSQRLRNYSEISDPLILFLDDDVSLEPDSVERLINDLCTHSLDAISADTFINHKMSTKSKVIAALSNWVLPHFDQTYAFALNRWGTFSYQNDVKSNVYLSQSCAGPSLLCKKDVYDSLDFMNELWLQDLGFPYGEDQLIAYKFHVNGYRLGVDYYSGIRHLDSHTSSGAYKASARRFYIRGYATLAIWHRTVYSSFKHKWLTATAFAAKQLFTFPFIMAGAIKFRMPRGMLQYLSGVCDAIKFVNSSKYKNLPPYILRK